MDQPLQPDLLFITGKAPALEEKSYCQCQSNRRRQSVMCSSYTGNVKCIAICSVWPEGGCIPEKSSRKCTEVTYSDPDHLAALWTFIRNLFPLTDSVKSPDLRSWSMEKNLVWRLRRTQVFDYHLQNSIQHEFPIQPSCTNLEAQSRCWLSGSSTQLCFSH